MDGRDSSGHPCENVGGGCASRRRGAARRVAGSAVRHRAVAGLPLASTTYYFSSPDDLIARASKHRNDRVALSCEPGPRCPGDVPGPETTAVVLA